MAAQSSAVWVWCAVGNDAEFRHPADIPVDDEAAAKACFIECLRGPKTARISPATMLQSKGPNALIAERGATREVPKFMILPWYEGLLILEELEAVQGKSGYIQASWWDQELRGMLDKERGKLQTGRLNGTLYAEKRLLNNAVTGTKFIDTDDREWAYRRENIKVDESITLVDGEDKDGFFRIKDITGYLPPWEAFHNEKCGFYQDFYQVKWEYPFSEVDYSSVENGCTGPTGATWEPDECLPAQLDHLRLAAKRGWIKRRRDQEMKQQAEKSAGSPPGTAIKKEKPDEASAPPAKMARVRRDGAPLERDLLRARVGHDFAPEAIEQALGQIRSGWPKQPQDYPKGFAVASPPGFCWNDCDCMDDQRPQRSWETRKGWLEEPSRTTAAQSAIQVFSEQTRFVRRRGQVSKMCFFETAQMHHLDQTHARAALELSQTIEKALQAVLQQIPVASLSADPDPVRIPGRVFLSEDKDYQPLRYTATLVGGAALPQWLRVEPDDGRLVVSKMPSKDELPVKLLADLLHAEGPVAQATCTIIAERFPPALSPWLAATAGIAQRYQDPSKCTLERGVRGALLEHFSEVYDFSRRAAKEKNIGPWLDAMARILTLLRSAAGANLALAPVPPRATAAK